MIYFFLDCKTCTTFRRVCQVHGGVVSVRRVVTVAVAMYAENGYGNDVGLYRKL